MTKETKTKESSDFDHELANECSKLLGVSVDSFDFPGGVNRKTFRLNLKNGTSVFVSQRNRIERADLERSVLTAAAGTDINIPELIATDGKCLLIQEAVPGVRLPEALHKKHNKDVHYYLDNALASLAEIHLMGTSKGFDETSFKLGAEENWMYRYVDRARALGDHFDVPTPYIDVDKIVSIIQLRKPRFIKWDARAGNAMARKDGQVYWIDWEHMGARNRLDDLCWFFGDEFSPTTREVEEELLEKYLPIYADAFSLEEARHYFYTMGVFQLIVRLGLIFKRKPKDGWKDYNRCLTKDYAGITLKNVMRLCERGSRWSEKSEEVAPLSEWFNDFMVKVLNKY